MTLGGRTLTKTPASKLLEYIRGHDVGKRISSGTIEYKVTKESKKRFSAYSLRISGLLKLSSKAIFPLAPLSRASRAPYDKKGFQDYPVIVFRLRNSGA